MKKMLSVMLIVVLLLGVALVPHYVVGEEEQPSAWAQDNIQLLKNDGIIRASLLSQYREEATRLRFTQALSDVTQYVAAAKGIAYDQYSQLGTFDDCYDMDILRTHYYGFAQGSNGHFMPEDGLQRQMAIVFLYRMVQFIEPEAIVDGDNALLSFNDAANVSTWARVEMNAMAALGFVEGSNGNCMPKEMLTNQESLVLISRIYQYLMDIELPTSTPTPPTPPIETPSWCTSESPTTLAPIPTPTPTMAPDPTPTPNALSMTVDGKTLTIGQTTTTLTALWGIPRRTAISAYGFDWWVYDTATNGLMMVGVADGAIEAFYLLGDGVFSGTYSAGGLTQYTDSNDNNRHYATLYIDKPFVYFMSDAPMSDLLRAFELEIFDVTNAFRAMHGESKLAWMDNLASAARAHSEDMATNDYFDHYGLNGSSPGDRISAAGVTDWFTWGENIAASTTTTGIRMTNQWINSSGHRSNMLKSAYTHLGVGMAYNSSSTYGFYGTQNFIGVR